MYYAYVTSQYTTHTPVANHTCDECGIGLLVFPGFPQNPHNMEKWSTACNETGNEFKNGSETGKRNAILCGDWIPTIDPQIQGDIILGISGNPRFHHLCTLTKLILCMYMRIEIPCCLATPVSHRPCSAEH